MSCFYVLQLFDLFLVKGTIKINLLCFFSYREKEANKSRPITRHIKRKIQMITIIGKVLMRHLIISKETLIIDLSLDEILILLRRENISTLPIFF